MTKVTASIENELREKIRELENSIEELNFNTIQKTEFRTDSNYQYEYHNKLTQILKDILNYKETDFFYDEQTSLSQDEQWRYFNDTQKSVNEALRICRFLNKIHQNKFITLPLPSQSSILEAVKLLHDTFFEMQNFTKNPSSRHKDKNSEAYSKWVLNRKILINKFHFAYQNLTTFVAPLFFSEQDDTSERLENIENIINDQANEAAKTAIGQFDKMYAALSKKFSGSAENWLCGTFSMATISIGVALLTIIKVDQLPLLDLGNAFHTAFILATLSALTVWCGRNYAINRHNELVNKYKELSLTTFAQFAEAGGTDPELRKMIIEKTTSAIFDNSPSGYLKIGKNESSSDLPSVLNVLSPLSNKTS